jgi:hypothetical protein
MITVQVRNMYTLLPSCALGACVSSHRHWWSCKLPQELLSPADQPTQNACRINQTVLLRSTDCSISHTEDITQTRALVILCPSVLKPDR